MSEPVVRHEFIEYDKDKPFFIRGMYGDSEPGNRLLNHWHEDLEVAYCVEGEGLHYINGECIVAEPGRLIVTNSDFIHNIIQDKKLAGQHILVSIVIIIPRKFLEDNFPEYSNFYFVNERRQTSFEIKELMENIYNYSKYKEGGSFKHLYLKGMVLQLLYFMCREGVVCREAVNDINVQKNIERMRGILQYLENHYREHITQAAVAKRFYFSKVYFSRYFKQCTGMTFTDYLMNYRVEKAREELLNTNKSISSIALDNGFSDDRRFIVCFKKIHGSTPLQYKKKIKQ